MRKSNIIERYYHTLRHLKPVQLRYQAWYRFRDRFMPVGMSSIRDMPQWRPVELKPRPETVRKPQMRPVLEPVASSPAPFESPDESSPLMGSAKEPPEHSQSPPPHHFRFLNIEHDFGDTIDWNTLENGRLWIWNLNYFGFLDEVDDPEAGFALMRDFIGSLHRRSEGLHAYPTALRGVSWIRFLSRHNQYPEDIVRSLYAQYRVLVRKIEYHLLGNHLLENAFSLLFAGIFFNDEAFRKLAVSLLREQLEEQILSDGAHFERSPMYHAILMERALDLLNLLQHNDALLQEPEKELRGTLEAKLTAMSRWLAWIRFSDGSLPMINDTAEGAFPDPDYLLQYAALLGMGPDDDDKDQGNTENTGSYSNSDTGIGDKSGNGNDNTSSVDGFGPEDPVPSGFRRCDAGDFELVADLGTPGPSYIPGHAHAGALSFILYYQGRPVLVERGVSTYEDHGRRLLERGTASHNTVVVKGCNQSDVWGLFRMGRRARVVQVGHREDYLSAYHNGYARKGLIHAREWSVARGKVVIRDRMLVSESIAKRARKLMETEGEKPSVAALLHLHPDIKVQQQGDTFRLGSDLQIRFENALDVSVVKSDVAAGFNRRLPSQTIRVRFEQELRTIIGKGDNDP